MGAGFLCVDRRGGESGEGDGGGSAWPVARMWTNARRMLRGQKEEKWLSRAAANAWLISLGEPNSRGGGKNVQSQTRMQHKQRKKKMGVG